MRLSFRKTRPKSLSFRRDARRVLDRASSNAGAVGIDSIDLLAAMLEQPKVVRLINELSRSAEPMKRAVESRSGARGEGPGLTLDAQSAIEATSRRALSKEADAGVEDLLIGLANADCQARRVLNEHGITAEALVARFGGSAP